MLGVLHVHLEVVLEVLADTGKVMHRRDPDGPEVIGVADARDLQQLRRVERATAQDHLAGAHGVAAMSRTS